MPYIPPGQKKAPIAPEFDPFKDYEIVANNEDYSDKFLGLTFANGKTRLNALTADADEDERTEHIAVLHWFWNAEPTWKRFINDQGFEYKRELVPSYVIHEYQGERRQRSARQPVAA